MAAKKLFAYFDGLALKTKLILSTSLLLIGLVAVGIAGQLGIRALTKSVYRLSSSSASADWLAQAAAAKPELLQNLWLASFGYEKGKPASDSQLKDVMSSVSNFDDAILKYSVEAPLSPAERATYDKLQKAWAQFKAKVQALGSTLKAAQLPRAELEKQVNAVTDEALALSDFVSELGGILKGNSNAAVSDAAALERQNIGFGIGAAVLAILLSVFSIVTVVRISRWVAEITRKLAARAAELDTASGQLADSSTRLSSSTTQQASALQETVSSVEEVSAMISRSADNAKLSQEHSAASAQAAVAGKDAVRNMGVSIEDINRSNGEISSQIEASNREISDIVRVITEIGSKTKVINDIVFQTKLLSFNASVEAARAGEHGKGFAVVAEEIGNLAQMSGSAAKDISEMLDKSIKSVEKMVSGMTRNVGTLVTQGKSKVEAGVKTAGECGSVLDTIVKGVSETDRMVKDIARACLEQAHGVEEINKAMSQLDQAMQSNVEVSRESNEFARALTDQSLALKAIVENLLTLVDGRNAARKAAPSPTTPPSGDEKNHVALAA